MHLHCAAGSCETTTACYTQRQALWKEWNQLENEIHLKLGGENIVVAVVIYISPYYRAVGCIKMGKHKFTNEIAQRKRQKAKHKLKFTPNAKPPVSHQHLHGSSFGSANEMTLMKNLRLIWMLLSQF